MLVSLWYKILPFFFTHLVTVLLFIFFIKNYFFFLKQIYLQYTCLFSFFILPQINTTTAPHIVEIHDSFFLLPYVIIAN